MTISCPHCNRIFVGDRIPSRHKGSCSGWVAQLLAESEPCLCGHKAPSKNKMGDHQDKCEVWLSRDKRVVADKRKKQTFLKNYGVENPQQALEVREKSKKTNLERYGVENPFQSEVCMEKARETMIEKFGVEYPGQSEVLQEQMRKTNLERYGAENPFGSEEIKKKLWATMLEKHGSENPQQAHEIRARTKETNLERYGGELLGSAEIREKARVTNLDRYGVEFPGGVPEVQAKVIATNLARYGVRHTCMDPEVRRKQLETMEKNYGSHYFASEEGKTHVRSVLKEKYGVEFPAQIEGSWEKAVATFMENYGVRHPLLLEEFLEKRRSSCLEKFGVESPIQNEEVKQKWKNTSIRNWGVDHPMKNKEHAFNRLQKMRPGVGPNGLERKILDLVPEGSLLFTGDFTFWRCLPKLGHHKNPDFIVPGPDPLQPKRGVTKVVEAFGDFWHSRMFTGKANFEHESELIEAYSEVGIQCLIIWESEIKGDPEGVAVRARLEEFLGI